MARRSLSPILSYGGLSLNLELLHPTGSFTRAQAHRLEFSDVIRIVGLG